MADDGGGSSGAGAGAGHATAGDALHDGEKITQQTKNVSRKSTWAKSAFDVQVSGMATPLQSRRNSGHGVDLDEYFVRTPPIDIV